jgi:hypothetical protein
MFCDDLMVSSAAENYKRGVGCVKPKRPKPFPRASNSYVLFFLVFKYFISIY